MHGNASTVYWCGSNVRESFTTGVIIMVLKMFNIIRCSYYPFHRLSIAGHSFHWRQYHTHNSIENIDRLLFKWGNWQPQWNNGQSKHIYIFLHEHIEKTYKQHLFYKQSLIVGWYQMILVSYRNHHGTALFYWTAQPLSMHRAQWRSTPNTALVFSSWNFGPMRSAHLLQV